MTCARNEFSVSVMTGTTIKGAIAHVTRQVGDRWMPCELDGKQFASREEAFKAMDDRGYTQKSFRRLSQPLPLFAKLEHCQREANFDARYRLLKWRKRNGLLSVCLEQDLYEQAKKLVSFHPVARHMRKGVMP